MTAQAHEDVLSRYVVGIDLGTTNCALGYVDTAHKPWKVETFRITQWVDIGQHEQRETLPSFHYELTTEEHSSSIARLPWEAKPSAVCVGVLAREAGGRRPGRRIASAKSWLSHGGVDRSADFLPWHGDADVTRLSPVDASAAYLHHLRLAWNHAHKDAALENQDVVITLPASFDEVARELTVLAAKKAGLKRVFLIEEPQAAFYAWIHSQGDDWHDRVKAGQLILVCDIGGGTTDFTLIRVQPAGGHSGQVQFHRVAVGNHLILGGDNLDLALAKHAESKLLRDEQSAALEQSQWERLVQAARVAKETMLAGQRPAEYTLSIPAEGSRLIGGAVQVPLSAAEVDESLVEGFFPHVMLQDRPSAGQSGFREFGLPYASDPAITRHLAAFLSDHRRSGLADDDQTSEDRPTWVLFNGGVMSAPVLRQRVVDSIARWFCGTDETWQPHVLVSPRLDLAVSHGAAYYAMVRRGEGVRIAANLGRTYYMQVNADPPESICLIPGNAEPGQRFRCDQHPLELQIGQPVQFPLWVSSTRLADAVGQQVRLHEGEATQLPPIYTALTLGKRREARTIRVAIESELSEIGTVGMWCVDLDSGNRWQLEFDIRSTLESDRQAHTGQGESVGVVDSGTVERCEALIVRAFGEQADIKPGDLTSLLQQTVELKREQWPPSLLRRFWSVFMELQAGRKWSAAHEARWMNLVGYCLRPGYGVAVDDWRVSQTWKAVYGKVHSASAQVRSESLVLWRRIAGGMTSGQQQQLASPLLSRLREKNSRVDTNELHEVWRLLGTLERLSIQDKTELGRLALAELTKKRNEPLRPALLWAIGRLGTRAPLYGPLNVVVPRDEVARWTQSLMRGGALDKATELAIAQLAQRTSDRHRDLDDRIRQEVTEYLQTCGASAHLIQLVSSGGTLSIDEESAVFGEALPLGIRLVR